MPDDDRPAAGSDPAPHRGGPPVPGAVATEHGDRAAFVDRLRRRLAGGVPPNPVHPLPAPVAVVPAVVPLGLDRADLVGSFERAATTVGAVVHRVAGAAVPAGLLAEVVAAHGVRTAVTSQEPEAVAAGATLAGLGVDVRPHDREAGAAADLGVTGAVAAVAGTGSVVVDAGVAGGRGASLLPTVHLCVVAAERLVATPGDVLRPLGRRPGGPPSALILVTGPSRTGDIEQILTMGVHGPVAVHVVVLGAPPAP